MWKELIGSEADFEGILIGKLHFIRIMKPALKMEN
jgi:hypothetical protein